MSTVITLRDVCKSYKLYHRNSDRLIEALLPIKRGTRHRSFEALKSISADIKRGEIVALVGNNGSGKSTLLKIITGVVNPSSGQCSVTGRINAMLELGAGLNPELSGLDNIFFSLSLQGISNSESKKLLQPIVEFAELGDFIAQPLKTYSSGMKARLAFAISSHSSPDILIVDEVLSVGDMRFRQKCTRRMREMMNGNTTVLFVSHDLQAVKNLCTRAIWLNEGEAVLDSDPKEVVEKYRATMEYEQSTPTKTPEQTKIPHDDAPQTAGWINTDTFDSFGEREASIRRARLLLAADNSCVSEIKGGQDLILEVEVESSTVLSKPGLGMLLRDKIGNEIISVNNYTYNQTIPQIKNTQVSYIQLRFHFPKLKNGIYSMTVALSDGDQEQHTAQHWIHDCMIVQVSNENPAFQRTGLLVLDEHEVKFSLSTPDLTP